jgi:hypothetical protein
MLTLNMVKIEHFAHTASSAHIYFDYLCFVSESLAASLLFLDKLEEA